MKRTFFTLALVCTIVGILFFAYQNSILVVQWPWHKRVHASNEHHATKKAITLHYWHNFTWHTEKNQLLMASDQAQALFYLINTWLTLLDEEHSAIKKVELQTAIVSPTGHELFLSFDRSPFSAQQSTYAKWMWVEGLLKTIKNNDSAIQQVRLLVQHKPMHDMHIDFSNSWPIIGFDHQ